jgi:hypothetical protein
MVHYVRAEHVASVLGYSRGHFKLKRHRTLLPFKPVRGVLVVLKSAWTRFLRGVIENGAPLTMYTALAQWKITEWEFVARCQRELDRLGARRPAE